MTYCSKKMKIVTYADSKKHRRHWCKINNAVTKEQITHSKPIKAEPRVLATKW